jgi:hypothetical protein
MKCAACGVWRAAFLAALGTRHATRRVAGSGGL